MLVVSGSCDVSPRSWFSWMIMASASSHYNQQFAGGTEVSEVFAPAICVSPKICSGVVCLVMLSMFHCII